MREPVPSSVDSRDSALTRAPGERLLIELFAAALNSAEADTVASLHRLNAECARAFAGSDAAWAREHLSDDFVCTLADGKRLDRARFLTRLSRAGRTVGAVNCDEIDVRPFGELGLVHGVAHSSNGSSPRSTRFTQVWLFRDDRWQLVAAQLTRVRPSESPRIL